MSQEEPQLSEQKELAGPSPLPTTLSPEEHAALAQHNEERHDWIEQAGQPDREVIRGAYRRMADFVVSTTDPDATVMPMKGQGRHLGYHTHYVVDGGKARIIMNVLVTPMARDGKPTHARPRLAYALPLETMATPGDRRQNLWHRR